MTEPAPLGKTEGSGFFVPGEEKAWEELITVCHYLKGRYEDDRGSLFARSYMEKTRGNGCKLDLEMFNLDIRKNFFAVSIDIHWNNLPGDVVESPLLQVFKMQMDKVLNNLIYIPFPTKGWTR